jgi:hypothetical protein
LTEHAEQGSSVAISANGETALVGALAYDSFTGAAWVYVRTGSTWTEQAKLTSKEASGNVQQGYSVALSADGDTALIGGKAYEGTGAAWVFTRSGSTWKEQEELPAGTGAGEETAQGESVALSEEGNTALIGGPGQAQATGAAWVFTRSGEAWSQQGGELLGEDATEKEAQVGHSVSLSENGDTALVGGYHDDLSVGAAWAFARSGSTWGEQEKLVGTGSTGGFPTQGSSVALSGDGDIALVGGAGDNSEVGATWVFARAPESSGEPEPKPGEKVPIANMGAGTTSSSTPGIASTPQAIEEVLLGCTKRALVLNDVLIHGSRVDPEGSAAKSLDGKKVKIVFDGGSRAVASATVGSNGEFSTTAPLPPARSRDSNNARYMAESGSQRSLNLKLTRRLSLEPPTFSGGTVTLVGQVLPPLTKPIATIAVQQELECGKTTVVAHVTPSASGRFRIRVAVPAAAKAGLYRLISSVRENTRSKRGFVTYSLPLPVVLG